MAMPVLRLLLPHVASGIGELASSIAAGGSNQRKRQVKRVLRKHGLRAADDVIKTLQSKYEQEDDSMNEVQVGSGGKKRRNQSKVYKRQKHSNPHHSGLKRQRVNHRKPTKTIIRERDIFG